MSMRNIKSLKDDIPYAKLYKQLKQFNQNKRGFSEGGFVMGGLSMEDGTPVNGFSPQFYQSELAQMVSQDATNLLQGELDKAKFRLKTPYDMKENATAIDTLGQLFSVFNDNAEKPVAPEALAKNAPNVSLSDVPGATQYLGKDGAKDTYSVGGSKTNIPIAMVAMKAEGMGNYNTLYNNQNNIKKSPFFGLDVTKMSLDQVATFSKKGGEYNKHNNKQYSANTTATGYYQMLGSTIKDILKRGGKELGITKNSLYNKETQDKMYVWYMSDTISRLKTLSGMEQRVMARWEAFRDNDKTVVRKNSKGENYNVYTPKNKTLLRKVIYEHLNVHHQDHPLLNRSSLGSRKGSK